MSHSLANPASCAQTAIGPAVGERASVAPRPAHAPDRFLAFAFAAADLLVEAAPDGVITFAAGAFALRFGTEATHFVGLHATTLIAPRDQPAFAMALATASVRGRIAPMLLHLNDARQALVSVAALIMPAMPGVAPRLCLTFGAPPSPASETASDGGGVLDASDAWARAAVLRVGAEPPGGGASSELALVELKGWHAAKELLSSVDQRSLRSSIGEVLVNASPGALASELADGRFGVLSPCALDLDAVVRRLQGLIGDTPAARHTRVDGTGISLRTDGLAPAQAARALRFALSRFAAGGMDAAREAGGSEGLAGIIAIAEQRAIAVRGAIAARRFRLLFQPVVDLRDRSIHHYEALIRPIVTPSLPAQTPQEFVTFAEAVGLAEELDAAVLDETLRVLRETNGPVVAVNMSGLSMQSASFGEATLQKLTDPAINRRLMVELTETAEIENMPAAAFTMTRLRAAGVRLCLDDFGAGAAAFRYLRDLKVDFVKIDGAYVHRAPRSPRERGLVAAMIDLAGSVEARTVAEMIETEEQAALMRELGVQFGQGWLFGRPGGLPGATH